MGYTIRSSKNGGYTRTYVTPLGVDRDGDGSNISPRRLSLCENMYRDYGGEGGGVIESVPGFRKIASLGEKINGIFNYKSGGKEYLLIHAGTSLYRMEIGNDTYTQIGTLGDAKSRGFGEGECFYLFDTMGMYKVSAEGTLTKIERESAEIYVPTAYVNGKEYEPRNLLTSRFREELILSDPWDYSFGTSDILYTVTDPVARYCAVSGVLDGFAGQLFIPRYVKLGEVEYRVTEVLASAFENQIGIISVRVADGVLKIGDYAFRGARSIASVTLPASVTEIGTGAFAYCQTLNTLYLGSGLREIGDGVFEGAIALKSINYALDAGHLGLVVNSSQISAKTVNYRVQYREAMLNLPVYSSARDITSATLDGRELYIDPILDDPIVSGVMVLIDDTRNAYGKTVILEGEYAGGDLGFTRKSSSFLDTGMGKAIGGFDAVTKCTLALRFDGRVFFAGNPELPNTVFYSERDVSGENNPLYIGAYNFFLDGTGYYPTVSMLAVRDSLAVFKAGDDGEGSIFYHTVADADGKRVYPRTYVHSGVLALGESKSFLDDPVFLSPIGLSALDKANISYERSIAARSHNVNRDLLSEDLKNASLEVWCGYLAVGVKGKIYLADSRATFRHETGDTEYEWFIITNVGTHPSDSALYRYSSIAPEGFDTASEPDTPARSLVYSENTGDGLVYFTLEGGKRLALYKTEERTGGSFSAAIIYHAVGDRLYFGTECGDVCLFNNDMRGIPPERLSEIEGFDPLEYKKEMGQKIHPDFYSFDGHAPRYVIKTAKDNCGIPHLEKSTVKGSLTVKCRGKARAKIRLEVGTDKHGYSEVASFSPGEFDFGELDFSTLSLDTAESYTLAFGEKEKRWVEKEITLSSESFASPIGIYSISYRYKISGGIKHR